MIACHLRHYLALFCDFLAVHQKNRTGRLNTLTAYPAELPVFEQDDKWCKNRCFLAFGFAYSRSTDFVLDAVEINSPMTSSTIGNQC